jgi:hypothetical protein
VSRRELPLFSPAIAIQNDRDKIFDRCIYIYIFLFYFKKRRMTGEVLHLVRGENQILRLLFIGALLRQLLGLAILHGTFDLSPDAATGTCR